MRRNNPAAPLPSPRSMDGERVAGGRVRGLPAKIRKEEIPLSNVEMPSPWLGHGRNSCGQSNTGCSGRTGAGRTRREVRYPHPWLNPEYSPSWGRPVGRSIAARTDGRTGAGAAGSARFAEDRISSSSRLSAWSCPSWHAVLPFHSPSPRPAEARGALATRCL